MVMMAQALGFLGATGSVPWLVSIVGGSATLFLLLTAAILLGLRRASASTRHAVLALAAASLLALPALRQAMPRLEVPILDPAVAHGPLVPPPSTAPRHPANAIPLPAHEAERGPEQVTSLVRPLALPDAGRTAATDTPPALPEAPVLPWPLSRWLLLAWTLGAAGAVGQLGVANLLMARKARRATAVEDEGWRRQLAEASAEIGLAQPVRLLMDSSVAVPVAFGYWHAMILLPPSAEAWPENRRRAVLLHELAHVERRDCLVQAATLVARGLYWPNPLVWWLAARLRGEAERACDDAVLRAGRVAAPEYATHLLEAARDLKRAPRSLAVVAVIEGSPLEARLMALLDPTLRRAAIGRRALAAMAALSLAVAGAIAGLQPVARALAAEPAPARHTEEKVALPLHAPTAQPASANAVARPGAPARKITSAEAEVAVVADSVAPEVARLPALPATTLSGGVSLSPNGVALDTALASVAGGSTPPAPAPRPAAAAAPSVPIIRISTEVVQIDAVVTDKSGRQVTNLRPEDFEVFENGQRKVITHLAYVRTGQGPISGAVDAVDPSGETKEPRTTVFVVDDLGLGPPGATWARQLLLDFTERGIAENDRVALVRTGKSRRPVSLEWGVSATRRAAEALRYNPWSRAALTSPDSDGGRSSDGISLFYQLAYRSLGSLKATVDALRALPGRKAVIFLSEGFGTLVGRDQNGLVHDYTRGRLDALYDDHGVRAALNSLTDLANRASVVIYAIDPAGLTTDGLNAEVRTLGNVPGAGNPQAFSASGLVAPQLVEQNRVTRVSRQDSLREIAGQTGGLAVLDNNDLHVGLDRILEDQSGYYLLAYEPDPGTFKGDITFHDLKVKVRPHGLKVRSRQGFYSVPDEVVAQWPALTHTE
jgi:VWFA-related protein